MSKSAKRSSSASKRSGAARSAASKAPAKSAQPSLTVWLERGRRVLPFVAALLIYLITANGLFAALPEVQSPLLPAVLAGVLAASLAEGAASAGAAVLIGFLAAPPWWLDPATPPECARCGRLDSRPAPRSSGPASERSRRGSGGRSSGSRCSWSSPTYGPRRSSSTRTRSPARHSSRRSTRSRCRSPITTMARCTCASSTSRTKVKATTRPFARRGNSIPRLPAIRTVCSATGFLRCSGRGSSCRLTVPC